MDRVILIVDDDPAQRRFLATVLRAMGHACEEATGGEAALDRLAGPGGAGVGLVLLDVNMPGLDGIATLSRLRAGGSAVPVLVLTSDGSITRAVEAMRAGAQDFLVKPVAPERLQVSIRNALSLSVLSGEVRRLTRARENRLSFDELVADSPRTREAIALARRAAGSDIPLLIEGESGTGKEVFARAVHGESARAGAPFVAVNCGALPAALVESILFGHEKGAFTGALARRTGKFQEAQGGTLFLDEVGELPAEAQVKLLRAIQMREVDPVGASRPVPVDIRLISATNRDLAAMIAGGGFREDLYYRIGVFPLLLPPLRDRREDLPALADLFLRRFAAAEGRVIEGFAPDARAAILAAPWPGNVRQLENTIHRAVVLTEGSRVGRADLRGLDPGAEAAAPPAAVGPGADAPPRPGGAETGAPTGPALALTDAQGRLRSLAQVEAEAIARALDHCGGRIAETARLLGIGRSTLYRKMEELRIGPYGG